MQQDATAQAAILATFGTEGLSRYRTALRARRLAAKRTTRQGRAS